MRVGTCHFVSFTKACDYFKQQGFEYSTSDRDVREIEAYVREAVENENIAIGKPEIEVGQTLVLLDNGSRYGVVDAKS